MSKGRLEAFSDGVLAIIITIMVLDLHAPASGGLTALRPLLRGLFSYLLSFIFIGIYWNNHHHMLSAAERINGRILWANLHLLFWLSLVPLVTTWMGSSGLVALPVSLYGVVLLMAGCAYFLLSRELVAHQGPGSRLAAALGRDCKGALSIALYAAAIPLAFLSPVVACVLYIAVAVLWFIPDRRIEAVRPG